MKLVLVLLLAALALPAAARSDDGGGGGGEDDEVRVGVTCAGGRAELRLEVEDEEIEVELRLDGRAGVRPVRIVILHERRLVYRGLRSTNRLGSLRLRLTIADWPWREAVTARVGLPSGRTCVLEATI